MYIHISIGICSYMRAAEQMCRFCINNGTVYAGHQIELQSRPAAVARCPPAAMRHAPCVAATGRLAGLGPVRPDGPDGPMGPMGPCMFLI